MTTTEAQALDAKIDALTTELDTTKQQLAIAEGTINAYGMTLGDGGWVDSRLDRLEASDVTPAEGAEFDTGRKDTDGRAIWLRGVGQGAMGGVTNGPTKIGEGVWKLIEVHVTLDLIAGAVRFQTPAPFTSNDGGNYGYVAIEVDATSSEMLIVDANPTYTVQNWWGSVLYTKA